MEDYEDVNNLDDFQVIDEWSESEEGDNSSPKNGPFPEDESGKKPSEGEIDAFLENVKSSVATHEKSKVKSDVLDGKKIKQKRLSSMHKRESLEREHRRKKAHRELSSDQAVFEERRISRSRENSKIFPLTPPRQKHRRLTPPLQKHPPTLPNEELRPRYRKAILSPVRRTYPSDSPSVRPEMGNMNVYGEQQPYPSYHNFNLPSQHVYPGYQPDYYPYMPPVEMAQPNPNFASTSGPYLMNNASYTENYQNYQNYSNSMIPEYNPYSQTQPYNQVLEYPPNPPSNLDYTVHQAVPAYLPSGSNAINTDHNNSTWGTLAAGMHPDYRQDEQCSLDKTESYQKDIPTSKSMHQYYHRSRSPCDKVTRRNRSRSMSRSSDSYVSEERKLRRHSRSPHRLRTVRKYSISPPMSAKSSKIIIEQSRIPTPPPPPVLSNYIKEEKKKENNKTKFEARRTQEAQGSKNNEKSNISLSCLLEAAMESSRQGKSKPTGSSVKESILYQCENVIRLLYHKRISGSGVFIPDPVEEVVINKNSSPLLVYHPYLSYNSKFQLEMWNCRGIKIPPVEKISSAIYFKQKMVPTDLLSSSEQPISSTRYLQFKENEQIAGSTETVSNIPFEQMQSSAYPVLQQNTDTWLQGSHDQPIFKVPATHQHNYMLSYPVNLSQANSQCAPKEIRNLTYPISTTSLSHPFDNKKGMAQSNTSTPMGNDSLQHWKQSNIIVLSPKMSEDRNVKDSDLQLKSKSPSSRKSPSRNLVLIETGIKASVKSKKILKKRKRNRKKTKKLIKTSRKNKKKSEQKSLNENKNFQSLNADRINDINVEDDVITVNDDTIYKDISVVSQNSGNMVVNVSDKLSVNKVDYTNKKNTVEPIVVVEDSGIPFTDFCHRVGSKIRKLQERNYSCSKIIKSLEVGNDCYKKIFTLKDGVLCNQLHLLKIVIPEEHLMECIMIVHENYHSATRQVILELLEDYTHCIRDLKMIHVIEAFKECNQCRKNINNNACLIGENSEKIIQDKGIMQEDHNDPASREKNLVSKRNVLNINTVQTCLQDSSSRGIQPDNTKEKQTEYDDEGSINDLKNDNFLSDAIESSIFIDQNTSNSAVDCSEKEGEESDLNQSKDLDFKTKVRAIQLRCDQSKEKLISLESNGGCFDEMYLLKGGMLCEKTQTAGSIEIKIVAPLSEVNSIISIVHTMSKVHRPESKLIAFFLKHFTYIPGLDEKVKKFVRACSTCST